MPDNSPMFSTLGKYRQMVVRRPEGTPDVHTPFSVVPSGLDHLGHGYPTLKLKTLGCCRLSLRDRAFVDLRLDFPFQILVALPVPGAAPTLGSEARIIPDILRSAITGLQDERLR